MNELLQIHESKNKEIIYKQRLARRNKGINYATDIPEPLAKAYKIHVSVKQTQTFNGIVTRWIFDLRLPIDTNYKYHWGDITPREFLNDLQFYSKQPRYTLLKENNRKDKWGWGFPKLRQVEVLFEQIDLQISDLAKTLLEELGIDFVTELRTILDYQREATDKEIELLESFILLNEQLRTLKLAKKQDRSYGYGYSKSSGLNTFNMPKVQYDKAVAKLESQLKSVEEQLVFLKKEDSDSSDDDCDDDYSEDEECDEDE